MRYKSRYTVISKGNRKLSDPLFVSRNVAEKEPHVVPGPPAGSVVRRVIRWRCQTPDIAVFVAIPIPM